MEKIKRIIQGDKVIWVMAIMLALISMLAVYSASESYANNRFHGSNAFVLLKHSALLLAGLLAMAGTSCVQYRRYAKILSALFWVSLPLLLLTIVLGRNLNSASRVIGIGFISFQTSDLAKVTLVGYLAMVLTQEREQMSSLKNLLKRVIVPILAAVGLIFPENFSTAALLFAVCLVMMFIGRVKMKYILGFVGTIVLVGGLAVFIMYKIGEANPETTNRASTWVHRIQRFLADDEEVDNDANFQVMQSKVAIAGGGVIGKSPGKSTQRNVLPHPYSDFIYAIILEEYGLAGGIFVLLIYMIILFRATRVVIRAPQSFGALLSFGLAFSLVMQAMVNMGVAVGLLPVTGQPLPFVSMGGTSLIFTGASIGMIISVTKDINKSDERTAEIEAAEADS